jgi:hypothetical protein
MKLLLPLVLTLSIHSAFLIASDHIDGPVTTQNQITDLTDFFAFKTPEKPGYLTLIANTHPLTLKHNHFSDKVVYKFTLREAAIEGAEGSKKITTNEKSEKVIFCSFVTPKGHEEHTMTCTASPDMKRTVKYNEIDPKFDSSGLRVFAGHRGDPFFFNSDWSKEVAKNGKIPPPTTENTLDKINVLSIAVDLDVKKLFGHDVSLLGMTVESLSPEKDGTYRHFDRIGRPEVTNITMVEHAGDQNLKDRYNQETAFHVSKEGAEAYRSRIERNIGYYDKLDGHTDWTPEKTKRYAEMIVNDFLVMDLSKPEKKTNEYFNIEQAVLDGKQHDSAGGRRPEDDFIDKLFTVLINEGQGKTISDGLDAPPAPTSKTFPYLGAPDFGWAAWFKASAANLSMKGSRLIPDFLKHKEPTEHDETTH